jgi:hypothetical protein
VIDHAAASGAGEVGARSVSQSARLSSRTRARNASGRPARKTTFRPKPWAVGVKMSGAPSSSNSDTSTSVVPSTGAEASRSSSVGGGSTQPAANARPATANDRARGRRIDMQRLRESTPS